MDSPQKRTPRVRILAEVPETQAEQKEIVLERCAKAETTEAWMPDEDWFRQNIPCMIACPANTRVPEYLQSFSHGKYAESFLINQQDNIFPHTLGRVCSRPCENACRHGFDTLGEPVAICAAKRMVGDQINHVPTLKVKQKRNSKVAIVGTGPAGLSTARDLALLGHKVTLFETLPQPGGMMTSVIPPFRLPKKLVQEEIESILNLGVELKVNHPFPMETLLSEKSHSFNAFVLATGCGKPVDLKIPGDDAHGVITGLEFMKSVNKGSLKQVSGKVTIIGGGYTAMDCARTAVRVGAKSVSVLYRRSENELVVDKHELEEAATEGIEFYYMVSVQQINSNKEGVCFQLQCVQNEFGQPGEDGRKTAIPKPQNTFTVASDCCIIAVGQIPEVSDFLQEKFKLNNGKLYISSVNSMTSVDGVFAAGDCVTGPTNIITAVAHGKKVALAVDAYIGGGEREKEICSMTTYGQKIYRSVFQWKERNPEVYEIMPREATNSVSLKDRTFEKETDPSWSLETGKNQADRCYLCNHNIQVDRGKCILCFNCVDACPNFCIKIVPENRTRVFPEVQKEESGNEKIFFLLLNEDKCIRCGLCIDVCPVHCISMEKTNYLRG